MSEKKGANSVPQDKPQDIIDFIKEFPERASGIVRDGLNIFEKRGKKDKVFEAPPSIIVNNTDGTQSKIGGDVLKAKTARASLFNRYSLFFFNNTESGATKAENYFDSPNRLAQSKGLYKEVRERPTTSNIIKWAGAGDTNAADYAWEDFLWCKDYGAIPNNYLITLRRFANPPADDLFNTQLNVQPDIGRMLTYLDGEANKWETCGLSWTHGVKWKPLKSEIQSKDGSNTGYGTNESNGGAMGATKRISSLIQTDFSDSSRGQGNQQGIDPYQNKNATFGPIDIIDEMQIRDKGLVFSQNLKLKFEYTIKSYKGINTKIAFIDLLSNILNCTANRGAFWGGEVRYYGGSKKKLKPFGDPNLLKQGKYGDFLTSMFSGPNGLFANVKKLSDANGGGAFGAIKGALGNMVSQIAGEELDKMGRPEIQALDALLTGEATGEWHVTIGNPANPIISIGNLILKNTSINFGGQLGPDDFPTKIIVECELEPAMPRDRTDIISMFSRNNRTYLTDLPQAKNYTGQSQTGQLNGDLKSATNVNNKAIVNESDPDQIARFPNHFGKGENTSVREAAKGIF